MKQLQPFPRPRVWWKRADVFLLLLAAAVILFALRLFCGAEGFQAPLVSPCAAEPVPVEPVEGGSGGVGGREVEAMPESGSPVRFLMLNAENYFVPGEIQRSRYVNSPKPEAEREAVAEVIASVKPEIVGLMEMGGPLAVEDLRQRLSERGLHYSYTRVLTRGGEERALALLSVYPAVADDSRADYGLFGQQKRKMLRGILDITLRLHDGRLFCFLGAHLKSRLGEQGAAASLRQREAQTLALYIQKKMELQPNLPMVVFGDWNDNPHDSSIRLLEQGCSSTSALRRLRPRDSRGEEWTLYYRRGSVYSTFDHIFLNEPMKRRPRCGVDCGIVDIPAAREASDHRAVWCVLR